jgi:hypothetical protein
MKRSVRRLAKRWGRLAVLVATVSAFLSAELRVELHDVFVVHVVCAEHGGQVEDVPRAAATGAPSGTTSKMAHTSPPASDDHQACEMPPGLTAGAVSVSAPVVLHPLLISFLDPQPPEGVPGRTGPPLLQEAREPDARARRRVTTVAPLLSDLPSPATTPSS